MRQFLRFALLLVLKWLARAIITRYRPKIVAITGSVGKTTTKELVAWVLSGQFRVAKTPVNANTPWGIVPIIIWPEFQPTQTANGWVKVSLAQYLQLLLKAFDKLIFARNYPEVLVLELAADRPGDIGEFNRFLKYDIGVVTVVGHVHLEFYSSPEALRDEKLSLLTNLTASGLAIVGEELKQFAITRVGPSHLVMAVGTSANTDVQMADFQFGQGYSVIAAGHRIEIKSAVNRAVALAVPFAVAVARQLGMGWKTIQQQLASFAPPRGRFEIYKLQRGIHLINDAYNANPESMAVALHGLSDLTASLGAGHRRVAILGEMRELGTTHETGHTKIGELVAKLVDIFIAVGDSGKLMAQAARAAGMSDGQIIELDWPANPVSDFLAHLVDNDVVLVKASKSIGLSELANQLKTGVGEM